jgi:signal-transduction protein with cAMP-binding, CBS, and nucleotidyltransferase domain
VTCLARTSIAQAARSTTEQNVGSIVVVDDEAASLES